MQQKNICFVTTTELEDPNWKPPFKHGLLVLNLIVHCDEATPGIHLTAIPYSRGCKRGPEVQASLGRAMAGMGYPSTWKDVLDENGKQIPKRNKDNEIIYNKDGTPLWMGKRVQRLSSSGQFLYTGLSSRPCKGAPTGDGTADG